MGIGLTQSSQARSRPLARLESACPSSEQQKSWTPASKQESVRDDFCDE